MSPHEIEKMFNRSNFKIIEEKSPDQRMSYKAELPMHRSPSNYLKQFQQEERKIKQLKK